MENINLLDTFLVLGILIGTVLQRSHCEAQQSVLKSHWAHSEKIKYTFFNSGI